MTQWAAAVEDRLPPMVGVGVAVVAVSTSAILIRWSGAPSLVKAFYRVLFTTAAIAPFALRNRGGFRAVSRRDLGVALAVHFASFFESLEWTTVAASVTLITTQPVFVGVGAAALLDERFSVGMAAGILVAMAGASVMSLGPFAADASTFFALVLLDEVPAVVTVLGAAVVLVGIAITNRARSA